MTDGTWVGIAERLARAVKLAGFWVGAGIALAGWFIASAL